MVDYKIYLPSVGLILLAVEYSRRAGEKYGNYRSVICIFSILIFFCLSAAIRIKTFETEISFWTDVIDKGGNKARGLNNHGIA